jgi:hypothetical protein
MNNKLEIDKFILEYNIYSKEYCDFVIDYYANIEKGGLTSDRVVLENNLRHVVSDTNTGLHMERTISLSTTQNVSSDFLTIFWNEVYSRYVDKYSILSEAHKHSIYHLKLQKAKVGEAYHRWHFESGTRELSNRVLTFILYLNDVKEGGETEFLYYPKRVKPKQGTIILFPGALTHAHRGNQALSNDKYIITGWVEL